MDAERFFSDSVAMLQNCRKQEFTGTVIVAVEHGGNGGRRRGRLHRLERRIFHREAVPGGIPHPESCIEEMERDLPTGFKQQNHTLSVEYDFFSGVAVDIRRSDSHILT